MANQWTHPKTLTIDGKTMTYYEWSRVSGVHKDTIRERVERYGWDPKRAVFEPARMGRPPKPNHPWKRSYK